MAPVQKAPLLIEDSTATKEIEAPPEINAPSGWALTGMVRSPGENLLILDVLHDHENGEHFSGCHGFQEVDGGNCGQCKVQGRSMVDRAPRTYMEDPEHGEFGGWC